MWMPRSVNSRGAATVTTAPSMVASTPRPASESNLLARGLPSRRTAASLTIARAIGCSDRASTAAPSSRTSSSVTSPAATTSSTPCRPSVSVPVLSKSTTDTSRASSSAGRLANQDAVAGTERRRDLRDERDREPEGVRTRDHENGHDAFQDEVRIRWGDQVPDDRGNDRRADRDIEEPAGRPVGEHLRPGLARLSIRNAGA